jgi:hypothetical protein
MEKSICSDRKVSRWGVGRSADLNAYFKNINCAVIEARMKKSLPFKSDR